MSDSVPEVRRGPLPDYLSEEAKKYRRSLDACAPANVPDNPKVTAKNEKRYGRNPFGGQSLNLATNLVHGSTGEQPAKFDRGPVPDRGNLREIMAWGRRTP